MPSLHHPIWFGITNFLLCFGHKRNGKLSCRLWSSEKAGVASRHCLASFLLLHPQLGNIKLDLKGAAPRVHGFVVWLPQMVQIRSVLPKRLGGQGGDTDGGFSLTGFWKRDGARGLRERGGQVREQSCSWAGFVGQMRGAVISNHQLC